MKKITIIITTILLFVFTAVRTSAAEIASLPNYKGNLTLEAYDLYKDNEINVLDLIIAKNEINSNSTDEVNRISSLLLGQMTTGLVEETEIINSWEAIEENENYLKSKLDIGRITSVNVNENLISVRIYSYGKFYEIMLNRIDVIERKIKHFDFEGRRITLGITSDGKFAWDTYSFDIVPGYFNPVTAETDLDEISDEDLCKFIKIANNPIDYPIDKICNEQMLNSYNEYGLTLIFKDGENRFIYHLSKSRNILYSGIQYEESDIIAQPTYIQEEYGSIDIININGNLYYECCTG